MWKQQLICDNCDKEMKPLDRIKIEKGSSVVPEHYLSIDICSINCLGQWAYTQFKEKNPCYMNWLERFQN